MRKTAIFPMQRPWSRQAAAELLDMSGRLAGFEDVGAKQLDAAVALHRMLLAHGSAYLGDEVGMGKTYVALATVALFRHVQPGFRVLYLAPSQNVLGKWHGRELPAFIRNNVRHSDMRVRGPDGTSPARSAACMRVDDWLKCAVSDPDVLDVFVPLSALSFQLCGESPEWYNRVKELAGHGGVQVDLRRVREKKAFKDKAAEVINDAIPYYDLVVIDEAHLLKGGAGTAAADRARFLARALGANGHGGTRRFGAALLLSGTPFDRDLLQLARQFELFARPGDGPAPHEAIAALAARKRSGEKWSEIQTGLKPYMIRRVQKMKVNGVQLSRNQYRVERRAEAGISLANDQSASALRQRIFTAVVQKRLIEHLDGANDGRFPMAMFSSWEAYSPPRKAAGNKAAPAASHNGNDDTPPASGSDALDIGKDDGTPRDVRALDGSLMEDVVGSYREVFGHEPPHPKLEAESRRLGNEAFGEGLKQLVFVRRLKSVDDLYLRLNERYDWWLGEYLRAEGMPGCPENMLAARRAAAVAKRNAPPGGGASPGTRSPEKSDELPAHGDTLFSWFFRGKLDEAGQAFIVQQQSSLPMPSLLRERLRDPERVESIIGELDWRGFVAERCASLPDIPVQEIAARASQLQGAATPLMRYRRLQVAWAQLQADSLPADRAQPFRMLQEHLMALLYETGAAETDHHIETKTAETLLRVPTVALAFYRHDLGHAFLPAWDAVWRELAAERQGVDAGMCNVDRVDPGARLETLDLQREVLFALLRLDHPFIDLYLGWLTAKRDDSHDSARHLVDRVIAVCKRDPHGERFGTASILRNLADAWEQIAKTNFAEFLKGTDRKKRKQWRQGIQQLLTPFAPVEWASGNNTDGRSAIARRFRMPGYPMVLVSTSVLQEGEDLHVCCDRVTHFGISGSPIGIEQKNGRVDRIGSRAQRRLLEGRTVEEAGIRVSFPHLSESLEWYQIRDLSLSINDYLRSIHEVGTSAVADDNSLAQTMANRLPIPPLLRDHLQSPFEPQWTEAENDVSSHEITRLVANATGITFERGTK